MHIVLQLALLHGTARVSIIVLVGATTIAYVEVDTAPYLVGADTVAPTI